MSNIQSTTTELVLSEKELYQTLPVCFQKGFVNSDFSKLLFYTYFLQLSQIEFDMKNKIETAAAGLIGNHYKITLSPKFWLDKVNTKEVDKKLTLLIHEIIHIIEQDCYHSPDYTDRALYNIAIDLKANSVIIDAGCEKHLPGVGETRAWNSVYKPKVEALNKAFEAGTSTKEDLIQQLASIPMRPIHPDDYDDPEINVTNCINKGTRWIYDKLQEDQEKQQQKNNQKSPPTPCTIGMKGDGSGEGDSDDDSDSDGSASGSAEPKQESERPQPDQQGNNEPLSQPGSNTYVNAKLNAGQDPTNNDFTDFDEISEAQKDFCNNQLEHMVSEVLDSIDKAGSNGIGNMPAGLKRLIDKIKNPPKPVYNWKKALRTHVSLQGKRTNVSRTFSKPNMFIEGNPRLKFIPDLYLLCGLDTSGSMSEQDILESLTELYNIRKILTGSLDVCSLDTKVYNVQEIKQKEDINRFVQKNGLRGGGGTDCTAFIEELNNNPKYSCGIYLTDGFVYKPRIRARKPYIVLITSRGSKVDWGTNVPVVKIPTDYFKKVKQ